MARDQGVHSKRRSFCCTLASVLVAPAIVVAQASKAIRRIGVLAPGLPDTPEFLWKEAEPLRQLGWVEGQNLQVERRYDNGRPEALQVLAEDLVRTKVEIIVTQGTAATLAAKRATTTIPIVFGAGDPVLTGLVASLARPGANVTGYSGASPETTAKCLSLLRQLLPRPQRIGVLWEAGSPYDRATRGQFEQVCRSLDLVPVIVEIRTAGEIGGVIALLVRQGAQALFLSASSFVWDHRFEIVNAATKNGLPTITDAAELAREPAALSPTAQIRPK